MIDYKSQGVKLIATERDRQVQAEGWTPEHDDAHTDGSLPSVAALYALNAARHDLPKESYWTLDRLWDQLWRWDPKWWKPKTPLRDLARAGALIAAEIDRRLRAGETLE